MHTKRRISVESIAKHAPHGFSMPKSFARFVDDVRNVGKDDPSFDVSWSDADRLVPLDEEGRRALLPFLRLGDGGVVAFWIENTRTLAIVHMDSEGGQAVVGATFDDFVARLAKQRTGIPDLDQDCAPLTLRAGKIGRSLSTIQKRFLRWSEAHSALRKPSVDIEGEKLRRTVMAIARKMLKLTTYTARDYWQVHLRVERKTNALVVTYMGKGGIYGVWPRVPAIYGIEDPIALLLTMVEHPRKGKWDVTVSKSGIVSFDRDKELLLTDPVK